MHGISSSRLRQKQFRERESETERQRIIVLAPFLGKCPDFWLFVLHLQHLNMVTRTCQISGEGASDASCHLCVLPPIVRISVCVCVCVCVLLCVVFQVEAECRTLLHNGLQSTHCSYVHSCHQHTQPVSIIHTTYIYAT